MESLKGYAILNKLATPDIYCIDPYTFATNLANGECVANYVGRLLATDKNDLVKIRLIVLSHNYTAKSIEIFDYGKENNPYVYFSINPR